MKTKAFVSWSGGKDCSLALYSFLKNPENRASHLIHMSDSSLHRSTHYIGDDLLQAQSEALNIPLIIGEYSSDYSYELSLKSIISKLKKQGVDTGIFGDIHLKEHRAWIERVCEDMGIAPVFPLWGRDASGILEELLHHKFRTIVVAVKNQPELLALIGRELTNDLIAELKQIQGVDLCGEHGEYHTFVVDSPLYNSPLSTLYGKSFVAGNTTVLPLHINKKS